MGTSERSRTKPAGAPPAPEAEVPHDVDAPADTAPEDPEREPPVPIDAEAFSREHFARVCSVAVQKAIVERLLLRRIPRQDLEDVAGNVTRALLEMKDPPPNDQRCIWAAHDIAEKLAARYVRDGKRRAEDPLPDDDHTDAPDPEATALPLAPAALVHEERHRFAEASLVDGTVDPRTAQMMAARAEDKSIATIAGEMGLAEKTVRNALSEGHQQVRGAWLRHATKLGLLTLLAVLVGWAIARRDAVVAWLRPAPSITPDVAGSARPVGPDPRAIALRADAQKLCDAGDTIGCLRDLDEAQRLDPAGEATPEVRAMRKTIEQPPPRPAPSYEPMPLLPKAPKGFK